MLQQPGTFRARAKSWDLGETSTGKEQIAIQFGIEMDDGTEETIVYYAYFTDAALKFTYAALRACGWRGNDLTNLQGLDANEVELVIEMDTYNGNTRAKVKFVNEVGTGAMLRAPLSEDSKRAFAAKMKGKFLLLDQMEGKPAPKPAPQAKRSRAGALPPEPPPHEDTDFPPV